MSFGNFQVPKNDSKYYWTRHSVGKMMQYGISAQRIKRVIRSYSRIEEGIAKNTVAVMQPHSFKMDKKGKKTWSQEIWVMYQTPKVLKRAKISKSEFPISKQILNSNNQIRNKEEDGGNKNSKFDLLNTNQLKIISVWRYPGVSPKNNPIPEDILEELGDMI